MLPAVLSAPGGPLSGSPGRLLVSVDRRSIRPLPSRRALPISDGNGAPAVPTLRRWGKTALRPPTDARRRPSYHNEQAALIGRSAAAPLSPHRRATIAASPQKLPRCSRECFRLTLRPYRGKWQRCRWGNGSLSRLVWLWAWVDLNTCQKPTPAD